MIYDSIENIKTYSDISDDIRIGLEFLLSANSNIANGIHQLSPRVKAIVSEYETRLQNENGFEAHRQFIDIQCTLRGQERIAYLPIAKLREIKSYSEEEDVAFYEADTKSQEVVIGNGYFAIFFPQDGHMPQLCLDVPMAVKKVVVKVLID